MAERKIAAQWWVLGLIALVVLIAVAVIYSRHGAQLGGTIEADAGVPTRADAAAGQSAGVPPSQQQ